MAKEIRWSDDADRPPRPAPPKVVRWSPHLDAAPVPTRTHRPPEVEPEAEEPIRRSPPRKNRSRTLLVMMSIASLLFLASLGIVLITQAHRDERRLSAESAADYAAGRYADAAGKFKQLEEQYPESESLSRYTFFARLAGMKETIRSAATKADPLPALDTFLAFATAFADSPLAKPASEEGADVVLAGQTLAGFAHEFALARLTEYRSNRRSPEPLARAEMAEAKAREAVVAVERFRDKGSLSSAEILRKFETLAHHLVEERGRATLLDEWGRTLAEPTAVKIEQFHDAIRTAGLAGDPEPSRMAAEAWQRLLARIRFARAEVDAMPLPKDGDEPRFFAIPVPGSPVPKPTVNVGDPTCFGVAGGCLFACDARSAAFLWGRRIAPPTAHRSTVDLPVVHRMPNGESVVVVGLQREGGAGIAALHERTGEAVWYQPLAAPCFARPAVIGSRLFAGLRDELGTVVEFDLATGRRLGSISLQQPLAANPILLSATGDGMRLLAVCRSLRAIILETSGEGEPLAFAGSLLTGHAAGSVLTDPIVVEAETPVIFLTLAAGPQRSRLMGYRLPPVGEPATAGERVPERVARIESSGWPAFPALCADSRIAWVTDSGTVNLSGIESKRSRLFPILDVPGKADGESVSRATAVAMDDDTFWVIANEQLVRYQLAVGRQGFRMVPVGEPRRVGEAVMRPQVFREAKQAVVGVLPSSGAHVRLLAFDVETGDTRWQVELKYE